MQDEHSDQRQGGIEGAPEAPPQDYAPPAGAQPQYGAPAPGQASSGYGVLFWVGVVGGLLLPLLGFVIGIVLLVQRQTRPALIVFAASVVGMAIAVALLSG
jgi:hypothetical protein